MGYNKIRSITSKKDCKCPSCKSSIAKGQGCIFDPTSKSVFCNSCGKDKIDENSGENNDR